MDGYSVTEAASVLGVPTERVWELLARGVLSGAPEGETGMRVFLQPRPAPASPQPGRPNGNGGDEPQRELSPFRELLTEFRSLTERYGQALLALGEARGEVAALRSRVDMLEARMDLRLPPGGTTGPAAGWTQPMPWSAPVRQPEPPSAAATTSSASQAVTELRPAASVEAGPDAGAETRTVRRDSPRRATESFAEALARAQDPSPPELPGGPEAAAALTALRGATEEDAPEAALPRELPPADEVPVADEVPGTEEAASTDAQVAAGAVTPTEEPTRESQPAEAPAEPASLGEDASAVADTATAADEAAPEEAAPEEAEPEPVAAAQRSDAGPAWQDDRYTAEIGEPDWWEAEAFPAAPPRSGAEAKEEVDEAADGGGRADAAEESQAAAAEPAEPETVEAPSPGAGPRPTGEVGPPSRPSSGLTGLRRSPPAADEETVLWFGRSPEAPKLAPEGTAEQDDVEVAGGAGEMEIAPTGGSVGPARAHRPGPLDDALAALDELSRATPPPAGAGQPGRPAVGERSEAGWTDRAIERTRRQPATPAGRAYRRLRRILPG